MVSSIALPMRDRCAASRSTAALFLGFLFSWMAPNALAAPTWPIVPEDRIAIVGNGFAERMRREAYFETLLHLRFPEAELRIRNFGWPADEARAQPRPNDYRALDDPYVVFAPTKTLVWFGFNESFAGPSGVEAFETALTEWVAKSTAQGQLGPGSVALATPVACEQTDNAWLPDATQRNADLALYAKAVERVAKKLKLPVANLFDPTRAAFAREPGAQYTTNGSHLNAAGERLAADLLDQQLFAAPGPLRFDAPQFEELRSLLVDLEWVHQQDYRMLNGWYVYGGRNQPFGVVNFPEEFRKIRHMTAQRDEVAWALARGEAPPPLDDATPALASTPTAFGSRPYSEPQELRILTPTEAEAALQTPPEYRVETFASEEQFPELANPVQMAFDSRGRLWASCMPTYPQWQPGQARPNDRLLIFTDNDGDGRADEVKTFANDLHCPTGFEFFADGVLVISQPQLLFLRDVDGDDRADERVVVLDGLASDDTHHACGAFEWTPEGQLVMLEGIALHTAVETPWGAFRHRDQSAAYRFDPRRWKMGVHIEPCFANPWCITHDQWGQGFVGDGTGAQQHWATPLSGARFDGRRGTDQWVHYEGPVMRPALGNGFLDSRHFPEEAQGNFYYACVINMNGILQFRVGDDGAGFRGDRIADLVASSDRNFRPGDPQIGPDGALYFVDWHNPLIGHMQYSQRDPNRDHRHGRIYRLFAPDRPLVEPMVQYRKTLPELLEQLREFETATRYRVRRELRARPRQEVLAAIDAWFGELSADDPQIDRLRIETLWVEQAFSRVDDGRLEAALHSADPRVRAAATHILGDVDSGVENPLKRLAEMVRDPHPRVRLEAVRSLSFHPELESVQLALSALEAPVDRHLDYTIESTLAALRATWAPRYDELAERFPQAKSLLQQVGQRYARSEIVAKLLDELAHRTRESGRRPALAAQIAEFRGDANQGKAVFQRNCKACHRVADDGADFGPNLSDVGKRLLRTEIIGSVLDPSEKIDPRYRATNVVTVDGKAVSGLVVASDDDALSLLLGDGKVVKIAQSDVEERIEIEVSSMPEKLYEAMSGGEFVDLLEFLSQQTTPPSDPAPAASP
ncbi:MAG: HEAT repeat domain-containing protein [Planctomycetales bacterium]|nr:HEAT repeat domain-containing protein [Planctomycetales bacterium]